MARSNRILSDAVRDAPRTRKELGEVLARRGIATGGQRLPHLLMHAELTAVLCSGPMRGKLHTYAAFDQRVPPAPALDEDHALAELARRYFMTRGPATLRDFAWWSGLTMPATRKALDLAAPRLGSRTVDGRVYWYAEATATQTASRVDLVQCYDEAIISYQESRDVLQTRRASFVVPRHDDGFVHVVLLDGQLLGHWRIARRRNQVTIETRIRRRVVGADRAALDDSVERARQFFAEGLSVAEEVAH
jgi:hypothetical protein